MTIITAVVGPPGAGKTTYVRDHAESGDLVVDLDALYSALAGVDRYTAPGGLERFAFDARDAVLERLKSPRESDPPLRAAWLVSTAPTWAERMLLRTEFNARVVLLAPSIEELDQRLETRPNADLYRQLARDWWGPYEPDPD